LAIFGLWLLKNNNTSFKISWVFSIVLTVVLIFLENYIGAKFLNIEGLLVFGVIQILLMIAVYLYITGIEYGEDFSFEYRVGFNLLVISEGIKILSNALKLNFNNGAVEYLIAVGYLLPIVAIIYIGFLQIKEDNRKMSLSAGINRKSGHKKRR
ncbi:MAG: hypothetical protein ACRC2K_00125, partial [Clostridium sp.]